MVNIMAMKKLNLFFLLLLLSGGLHSLVSPPASMLSTENNHRASILVITNHCSGKTVSVASCQGSSTYAIHTKENNIIEPHSLLCIGMGSFFLLLLSYLSPIFPIFKPPKTTFITG